MKILLDEMYTGLKPYLAAMGWETTTTEEVGINGASDLKVVEYAKQHELVLVTHDQKAAELADLKGVKSILVGSVEIAKAIDQKLKSKNL